jgi:hypothetical protein
MPLELASNARRTVVSARFCARGCSLFARPPRGTPVAGSTAAQAGSPPPPSVGERSARRPSGPHAGFSPSHCPATPHRLQGARRGCRYTAVIDRRAPGGPHLLAGRAPSLLTAEKKMTSSRVLRVILAQRPCPQSSPHSRARRTVVSARFLCAWVLAFCSAAAWHTGIQQHRRAASPLPRLARLALASSSPTALPLPIGGGAHGGAAATQR